MFIRIYDSTGRMVRVLDLGHKPAGWYLDRDRAAHWDGRSSWGERASSEVYFYQLEAGDFRAIRKLMIVK